MRTTIQQVALLLLGVLCLHTSILTQGQGQFKPRIGSFVAPTTTYALPIKAEDLKSGERYFTGNHAGHDNPDSPQSKAEDFGAIRYLGDNKWTGLKSKTNGSKISDYLIYDQPFYAMEGGVVCGCWRNAPENPNANQRHTADAASFMAGGGNHLWILQDNGVYALYAHAKPGTIPESICPNNASLFDSPTSGVRSPDIDPNVLIQEGQRPRVEKGQFLGKVGCSGTTIPHLHIHMEKDGNAIPMRFEKGMTAPINISHGTRLDGTASINNWTRLNGNELPHRDIMVWPPRSVGREYTRHKFGISSFQRMFDHLADSGYEPVWIDGYSVANKAYLNFSWQPRKGPWKAFFGLTASGYQNAFNNRDNLVPTFVDTYTLNGQVRYNVIFKQESGTFLARHGLTYNQHKAVMGQAKERGLQPVNISVVSVNNQRKYTVLYRKRNYNGHYIKSQVKEADYQKLYDDYKAQGFSPVYINAYKHGSQVYFTTIFARNGGGQLKARHKMSASKVQTEFQSAMTAGYQTKMITAFDGASSQHRFAGLWRK